MSIATTTLFVEPDEAALRAGQLAPLLAVPDAAELEAKLAELKVQEGEMRAKLSELSDVDPQVGAAMAVWDQLHAPGSGSGGGSAAFPATGSVAGAGAGAGVTPLAATPGTAAGKTSTAATSAGDELAKDEELFKSVAGCGMYLSDEVVEHLARRFVVKGGAADQLWLAVKSKVVYHCLQTAHEVACELLSEVEEQVRQRLTHLEDQLQQPIAGCSEPAGDAGDEDGAADNAVLDEDEFNVLVQTLLAPSLLRDDSLAEIAAAAMQQVEARCGAEKLAQHLQGDAGMLRALKFWALLHGAIELSFEEGYGYQTHFPHLKRISNLRCVPGIARSLVGCKWRVFVPPLVSRSSEAAARDIAAARAVVIPVPDLEADTVASHQQAKLFTTLPRAVAARGRGAGR